MSESITLQHLFEVGIGDVQWRRVFGSSPTSTYTSHHDEISNATEKSFYVPDDLSTFSFDMEYYPLTSTMLRFKSVKNGEIELKSEQDTQQLVLKLLEDIVIGLGLASKLIFFNDATLGSTRSDIWIVKVSGSPVAVIEVKLPHKSGGTSKLDDRRALGQVFDYMIDLRASFGQCDILGMVTTMDEWRVCWLPDTDEFATSTNFNPPPVDNLIAHFPLAPARELSVSAIYKHSEQALPSMIAMFLLKALNCRSRSVPLLSTERVYYTMQEDSWGWVRFSETELHNIKSLNLKLPHSASKNFKVLRKFHEGEDGKVMLAINSPAAAPSQLSLVAIKQHFRAEDRGKEKLLWLKLFDQNTRAIKLVSDNALLLPFVFHCVIRSNQVCFDFDLAHWGMQDEVTEIGSSDLFSELSAKLADFITANPPPHCVEVAKRAISKMAQQGYVHEDLKWSHVALLPEVATDEEGKEQIVALHPLLIDLVSVKECECAEAERCMIAALKEMCEPFNLSID